MNQSNRRPRPHNDLPVRSASRPQRSGNPGTRGSAPSRSTSGRPVRTVQAQRSGGAGYKQSRFNGSFMRDFLILIAGSLVAVILALILQVRFPDGFPVSASQKVDGTAKEISEIYSSGPIRLNEVMTSDRYTVMTDEDDAVDWIEVLNISSAPVDLDGYRIAKTANAVNVFTFPEMRLEPGECVMVFADSKLRNTAGEELHAPFRLSAGGDTLMLFNPSGTAIDTVNIPALAKDVSYARKDTSIWEVCEEATPSLQNTHENYLSLTAAVDNSPVIINEVAARNKSILADENGMYFDYIELYNRSGEPVNLKGWYLSDKPQNIRRWRFPDVTIGSGEYLVVFASGLDRTEDPKHLHTNFSLSSEGEHLVLSDNHGRRMDEVTTDLMQPDVVYLRNSDGSWSTGAGTPNAAN